MVFQTQSVWDKIGVLEKSLELAFAKDRSETLEIPLIPARDISLLSPRVHPPKKGLSYKEGQARLLHDLGNIELQAMELGLRTLFEFPEAPPSFREELVEIVRSEAQHLKLCLQGIEALGFQWGQWPIHTLLWQATSSEDSLLDRILIVHRYLEGSGLDAGETLIRRLDSVLEGPLQPIVNRIFNDEVGHVEFGSRWYREVCRLEKRDSSEDFPSRMRKIRSQLPKRIEPIARAPRLMAGFTIAEIEYLEQLRNEMRKH
jgi:uncharacterized ferritin-like protein (DUF455 family)